MAQVRVTAPANPVVRGLAVVAVVALLVVYLVVAWRRAGERRRRWREALCPECGYDVRMNAEKCPECGTVIRRFPRHPSEFLAPDDRR